MPTKIYRGCLSLIVLMDNKSQKRKDNVELDENNLERLN